MAEINATQMRDALAWGTNDQEKAKEPSTNPWTWFWEAIQGDFNDNRSAGQISIDAAISMIPLVDQVCDVRDLVANCKKLHHDPKDTWAWVALALTLIGLFPSLGSLVKGVLKIFFTFVRRSGGDAIVKAVDAAMTWVVTFLRRREVQKYLGSRHIDEVLKWLVTQIKTVRGEVTVKALTAAFDRAIKVMEGLVNKVSLIPTVGSKAKAALEQVREIRNIADEYLGKAIKPVQNILDTVVLRLERKALQSRHGIVNAKTSTSGVHCRRRMRWPSCVRKRKRPMSASGKKSITPASDSSNARDCVAPRPTGSTAMSEAKMMHAIATSLQKLIKPAIPVNIDLWDIATIAALLKRSTDHVSERVVCLPDFPKAIRLPAESGKRTRPLWKATEVLAWIDNYRETKTKGTQ